MSLLNDQKMTQEEKQLIDRYLDNSLTGFELKEFLDRLETDKDFRNMVSFHNLLIEGIQDAEDKRLASVVVEKIGYSRPTIPLALKLIFTFLIITTGGIVLWNYTGPDSSGNKHNYFSLNFFKDRKRIALTQPTDISNIQTKKSSQKKYLTQMDSIETMKKFESFDSAVDKNSTSEEIIVKHDQLLISVTLNSTVIDDQHLAENTSENSIAKTTADKLNPEGSLPEIENKKGNSYNVEFWVSPINYRGYKLFNEKLILFGIEEPDAVQLFSKEEKLWMKYGKAFYCLEKSENFESFVATNDIPSALK